METQPQVRTPTSMTTPSSSGDGFAIAEFQDMKMQPALERATLSDEALYAYGRYAAAHCRRFS